MSSLCEVQIVEWEMAWDQEIEVKTELKKEQLEVDDLQQLKDQEEVHSGKEIEKAEQEDGNCHPRDDLIAIKSNPDEDRDEKKPEISGEEILQPEPSSSKAYKCPHCQYACKQRGTLKAHMWTHSGKKPFRCVECDYSCTRACHLKVHLKKHENPRLYMCNVCSHREGSYAAILAHGKTQCSQKFVPACAVCGCFSSCIQAVLEQHVLRHITVKEFNCEICSYTSTAACILKRHVRTHTGEKPYKCDACDYRCTDAGLLKRHKRTHSGEKPFKCSICEYSSSQTSTLQSHMWTHNGQKPFGCTICDYRCNRASNLRTHMWKHDGQKLFPCKECDFKCTTAGNLRTHMLRKHQTKISEDGGVVNSPYGETNQSSGSSKSNCPEAPKNELFN